MRNKSPAFTLPQTFLCFTCKKKVFRSRGYKTDVSEAVCRHCYDTWYEKETRKALFDIGLTNIYEFL